MVTFPSLSYDCLGIMVAGLSGGEALLQTIRRLFSRFYYSRTLAGAKVDVPSGSDFELIFGSDMLELSWYGKQVGVPQAFCSRKAACKHYLQVGWRIGYSPGPGFDGAWYLQQYPDVAASGMNPLVHYLRYGCAEGRLPRKHRALVWEHYLWAGLDAVMLPRLVALLDDDDTSAQELSHTCWALARWYAWCADWQQVEQMLGRWRELEPCSPSHLGPVLLASETLLHNGQVALALSWLDEVLVAQPVQPDLCLAMANLLSGAERLDWINRPFLRHGLIPLTYRNQACSMGLDNLAADHALPVRGHDGPVVSVIMPAWNAAHCIATALRGLFAQSWQRLEILVVDDASDDDTWAVLQSLAEECPAEMDLKLLRHEVNQGAYAARNTALMQACGELITCHDADDWSHPEKIACQVVALRENPQWLASVSHWVRTSPELLFHRWRVEEGWIYRNVSSLMFRRAVFERLGYWDRVSVNADTEYYYRIRAAFGEQAIGEVLPGVPLSFGRADGSSLSQHSATHLATQFVGLRKEYMDAAHRWHRRAAEGEGLYLSARPSQRPFYAPPAMCREALSLAAPDPLDLIQQSGFFDPVWYCERYPDLLDRIIDPLQHFFEQGAKEGRDPGPGFSSSAYHHQQALLADEDPLLHYLTHGVAEGASPRPVFYGQTRRHGAPVVLLCGHQAGQELYGAERSLLDMLKALHALGFDVVVSLPELRNTAYLDLLREQAIAVAVLPYGWWQAHRPDVEATIQYFSELLERFSVDWVYLNTLVLHEPALAARRSGRTVVVHVRELPEEDRELFTLMGASAEGVARHLLSVADELVANSNHVAAYLEEIQHRFKDVMPGGRIPVHVVPNTVEMDELLSLAPSPFAIGNRKELTVGMIGSNLPKKGLADFVAMAQQLAIHAPSVRCVLYGPNNHHIAELFGGQGSQTLPDHLSYGGYVANPANALTEIDVLVNLSHFQESFGRSVLEAQAASRPVICYDWGGLPELVIPGETGFLCPLGDYHCVVRHLAHLAHHPETVAIMGNAARKRARTAYGWPAYLQAMERAHTTRRGCTTQIHQACTFCP